MSFLNQENTKWIYDNYTKYTGIKELLKDFNIKFNMNICYNTFRSTLIREGVKTNYPNGKKKIETAKSVNWIKDNIKNNSSIKQLWDSYNICFNKNVTFEQFRTMLKNHDIQTHYINYRQPDIFTQDRIKWIRDNIYRFKSFDELTIAFNSYFGVNAKKRSLVVKCSKFNIDRDFNAVLTKEQVKYLIANADKYECRQQVIEDLKNEFGVKITLKQLQSILYSKGINVKKKFFWHGQEKPLYSEFGEEKYRKIKIHNYNKQNTGISDTSKLERINWVLKRRYMYEQYHNVKLNDKDYIIHLDGNYENFSKDNLVRLEQDIFIVYQQTAYNSSNKQLKTTAIKLAELKKILRGGENGSYKKGK